MTISIDTNVIAALWKNDHSLNAVAVQMLGNLAARERLVISGPVYAELMAGPLREEESLDMFFSDTGIEVDWAMDEDIWREAGRAYLGYVRRRKLSAGGEARRILTDFLIGAHALVRNYSLLTMNAEDFAVNFPALPIISA
jgi:predicted nucleic acid-binding protein